ncbi:MAG: lycopene cyclase [Chitinophagaceae bacterium]|nr:lycopene cyclase [Chitinophagaceae bacterium]
MNTPPLNNQTKIPHYDYIIAGAGAAGLSLLMRMLDSPFFQQKRILIADKSVKNVNDRTWCFWEKNAGYFENIVFKKWESLRFFSDRWSDELQLEGYQYKMIRGIDFYNHCFARIQSSPLVDFRQGEIKFVTVGECTSVLIDGKEVSTGNSTVFSSIPAERSAGSLELLQHFKGWIIETNEPVFDQSTATLMDFRVPQNKGTTFCYTMPFSTTTALVEYTVFSEELISVPDYESGLRYYIDSVLKIRNYRIVEEEYGIIPMTNANLPFLNRGIYYIGTAGGQTKPSTGYTFQFIQGQSELIVDMISKGKTLITLPSIPKRFQFYDSVLLQLLKEGQLPGNEIFSRLFSRNKASLIFKFLDNQTNIREELSLISTLQIRQFFKAALKQAK